MEDSASYIDTIWIALFAIVIVGTGVIVTIFSRLKCVEDAIDFYRDEYASLKRRLYAHESEIFNIRRERNGLWFTKSETRTKKNSASDEEKEPSDNE